MSFHTSLTARQMATYVHVKTCARMFTGALPMTAEAENNPDADTAERWEGARASVLLTQQSSLPGKESDTADSAAYR